MIRISLAVFFVELMSGLALGQQVVVTPEETDEAIAAEVTLENTSTQVVLRDGCIVSLLDKTRSVQHVSPEADRDRGLFRIQLVEGIQPVGEVDATQMTSRVLRRAADALEIEFEHPKVTARVRVCLSQSPGETHWSMAAESKDAALAVGQVTFPVVVTPRSSRGEEKRCLFPIFEGRFSPLNQPPMWRPYPAHLFAQMIACVGTTGGFLLWTDDGQGHVKAFGFTNLRSVAMFGVRHQMPYEPGRRWEMPYHTRLSFCGGTWQDAADIYRVWATTQPWSNTPLRERQDVPDLLRHGQQPVDLGLGGDARLRAGSKSGLLELDGRTSERHAARRARIARRLFRRDEDARQAVPALRPDAASADH